MFRVGRTIDFSLQSSLKRQERTFLLRLFFFSLAFGYVCVFLNQNNSLTSGISIRSCGEVTSLKFSRFPYEYINFGKGSVCARVREVASVQFSSVAQ